MNTLIDIWVITKRNLTRYTRVPQLVVFSTIQPVMFLLLFTYVFGGAIGATTGGQSYIQFLLPGVIVQSIMFGSIGTGLGLAEDMSRGMIDRFRSLPISRAAVLAGRTIADTVRNLFVIALMVGVGLLMGFRVQNGIPEFLAAMALTLAFGFAFSWISATIGLALRNIETVQSAGFIWMFPLVFASSIFVPIQTMPNWLKSFAEINPITVTVNAVRALSSGFPIGDNLWQAVLWIGGILILFVPLAVNRYRQVA